MLLRNRSVQGCIAPTPHGPTQWFCSSVVPPLSRHVVTKASSTPGSSSSGGKASAREQVSEYLSPFSAVDPSMHQVSVPPQDASSTGSQQDAVENDKWGDVLSVNHTLSSLYIKNFEIEPFKQRDWEQKRRENDLKDVTQAGSKLGVKPEVIQANLQQLQALVPGLLINLDKMKASDWAKLLRDIDSVVAVVITLKTHYPKVDTGSLLKRKPKLLLSTQQRVDEDAVKVKSILASRVQDIDSIIDAVPDLMNPQQLTQSLSNLVAWFPNHDPFELLQQNPQILENPNVEADPTYGEITTAG